MRFFSFLLLLFFFETEFLSHRFVHNAALSPLVAVSQLAPSMIHLWPLPKETAQFSSAANKTTGIG